jgi:hypothetical protein
MLALITSANPLPSSFSTAKRRSRLTMVLYGCFLGLVLAVAAETANVMLGRNFHEVVPGRVYRCAQQDGDSLAKTIRNYGIRTVVNLRGNGLPTPWYLEECRTTHRLCVSQEDIAFSASRLPSVTEIRQLVRVLDHSDYPILLHCRQGADRTGLAAVMVALLQRDADLATARRQLSPRFGHIPLERAGHLDRFLDLYEEWLSAQGRAHSSTAFRQWAEHEYCPGECRCSFEPLELPPSIRRGQPARVKLRVRNTGVKPWHLRQENNAGIHLAFLIKDAQDRGVTSGRSGLFDASVLPNDSIDLTFVIPSIKSPGRYRLLVDMVDEQHCWFYQTGSEPLERELEIHD